MNPLDPYLDFLKESERLKNVHRQTYPIGIGRHENSAEHSWSLALASMTLAPLLDPHLDLLKIIKLLILHDLVEIDAGDTFCYGEQSGKLEAERQAAERIFSILPEPQRSEFKSLWMEFENRTSPEAIFANALDRFFPILQNANNQGGSWVDHKILASQVRERNQIIQSSYPQVWNVVENLIQISISKGWLKDA